MRTVEEDERGVGRLACHQHPVTGELGGAEERAPVRVTTELGGHDEVLHLVELLGGEAIGRVGELVEGSGRVGRRHDRVA